MKIRKRHAASAQATNPVFDDKDTRRIVQKMHAGGSTTADFANSLSLQLSGKSRQKYRIRELDVEIEKAKKNATNPANYHSVWIELVKLALGETGPFSAVIDPEKGLQYTNSHNAKAYFSKDALRKRMNRRAR